MLGEALPFKLADVGVKVSLHVSAKPSTISISPMLEVLFGPVVYTLNDCVPGFLPFKVKVYVWLAINGSIISAE